MKDKMGISGRVAKLAQNNPITPIVALLIVILGVVAILITPKEEDPQIDVTMVDVYLSAPGYSAREVETLISTKAENAMAQIAGVDHVYSTSMADNAVITVQFKVGIKRQEALVKSWNQVMTELHWPASLNINPPVVRARGINDVPILSLTLFSNDLTTNQNDLGHIANTVAQVLQRVPGSRNIKVSGGSSSVVKVVFDPVKAAGHQIDISTVIAAIQQFSGRQGLIPIQTDARQVQVELGQHFNHVDDVAGLVVSQLDGHLVLLKDIASVSLTVGKPNQYVQFGYGGGSTDVNQLNTAVSISIAKQEGENAIDVANAVLLTIEDLKGRIIPDSVTVNVSRNSGFTAQQKANKLIQKLLFATLAVVVLVFLTLGKRAALIVGVAVGLTLLITLFSSWVWGFTLNRISLFALIFSIGILVDDAIVVIENIHRRQQLFPMEPLKVLIPKAIDEVGSSTILATFTVMAALIPMAFVSGLMGPYMSPIPINASTGMLLSLIIAFTITPWLALRWFKSDAPSDDANPDGEETSEEHKASGHEEHDRIGLFASNILSLFVSHKRALRNQWLLFVGIVSLMFVVMILPVGGQVLLKMLPFDNKSSLSVVVDMPEGTTLEDTLSALQQLSDPLRKAPVVVDFQLYAGVNAPIDFNGLVRQYYLRQQPHLGEININILDKGQRDLGSHDIAKLLRATLLPIATKLGANIKIIEQPSGPPTLAPLVAEVYGPDAERRRETATKLERVLANTPEIVDTDTSIATPHMRLKIVVDNSKAQYFGITKQQLQSVLGQLLTEQPVAYLHDQPGITAIPIIVSTGDSYQTDRDRWLNTKIQLPNGESVVIGEFIELVEVNDEGAIYHKDMRPVIYVVADMAGETDSPLYGMFAAQANFDEQNGETNWLYTQAPQQAYREAIKWDGEWKITYETFRDMGIAYSVGLVLIYLLIVAQFKNYMMPLIIMAPIPLTVIGIFPGHWLMAAKFTAPSMIGMIALAGIIVRNSILLVDFIESQIEQGVALQQAVIMSAQMRARPIILTALAAMIGATFIVSDPIFKGLAVSLIFGIAVSSILTLIVIPVAYYRNALKKHAV